MKHKTKTMQRVGVISALLVLSGYAMVSLLYAVVPKQAAAPTPVATQIHPPLQASSVATTYLPPVHLTIAKLSLSASVAAVGLAGDNTMDIDKQDVLNTAWYKLGPKPGEVGSAVIAGHYGWKDGRGSIFNTLHTLQTGDVIAVDNEKGTRFEFSVREIRRYKFDADTREVFQSQDGIAHLNLITCDGAWDQSRETYTDRLVVFSDIKQ